jgi:uncharacterized protein YggU (UPF0235/DUF167 family)
MSVQLEPHAAGTILPVRAQAGARRSELRGEQAGALKVAVTQVAEKGKANDAIIELLCESLQLHRSAVELIAGQTSPRKRFLIRDMTPDELARRLAAVCS